MNDQSREYEVLIQSLLACKLRDAGLDEVKVLHDEHYIGKASGHSHQIDVSFEFAIAGVRVLVLVECKHYDKNVGIDDVLEFSARMKDIGAHKGIVVSTKGFQLGAHKIAKSNGIALVVANSMIWSTHVETRSVETYLAGRRNVMEYLAWMLDRGPATIDGTVSEDALAYLSATTALSVRLAGFGELVVGNSSARIADPAFTFVGEDVQLTVGPTGLPLLVYSMHIAGAADSLQDFHE